MSIAPPLSLLALLWILFASGLCYSSWYGTPETSAFLAFGKLLGLAIATFGALAVRSRLRERQDPDQRPWSFLFLAFLLTTVAQSILAYHQVFLDIEAPFPSPADPLFVLASLAQLVALIQLCVNAYRSSAATDTRSNFILPAVIVLVVFALSGYSLLSPAMTGDNSWIETALNLYYPAASFLTLAPLAVMMRFGLRVKEQKLWHVWLPLGAGFACVLLSDVLFSYYTSFGLDWLVNTVDLLYFSGYWLLPLGVFVQLDFQTARLLTESEVEG